MKKIIVSTICLVLLLMTAACSKKATYKFNVTDPNVTRNSVVYNYSIIDDNSEITSSSAYAKISLKGESTAVKSFQLSIAKSTSQTKENSIAFSNLKSDTEYDVNFYCTVGKSKVDLLKTTIKTSDQGTEDNPYQITTKEQFKTLVANDASGYYELANDIDFEQTGFEPLFNSSTPFTGSFDGKNHSITNFRLATVESSGELSPFHLSTNYGGLFGYLGSQSIVKNLNIVDAEYQVYRGSTCQIGLVAGYNLGTIENINIENVQYVANMTSSSTIYVGGIVGFNKDLGVVKNCKISGSITAQGKTLTYVGGICGNSESSSKKCLISECENNASITVKSDGTSTSTTQAGVYVGGIIGSNSAHVKDCVNKGNIDVSSSMKATDLKSYRVAVGGVIGGQFADAATAKACASVSDITVKSNDAKEILVGSVFGINGTTEPAYATFTTSVGKANISVEALDSEKVLVVLNGAYGKDLKSRSQAPTYYISADSKVKLALNVVSKDDNNKEITTLTPQYEKDGNEFENNCVFTKEKLEQIGLQEFVIKSLFPSNN